MIDTIYIDQSHQELLETTAIEKKTICYGKLADVIQSPLFSANCHHF